MLVLKVSGIRRFVNQNVVLRLDHEQNRGT